VKGVGIWTAEMFLIFCPPADDVWPVGDNGIQRAAPRSYGAKSRASLAARASGWPVRTYACWYLWRSLSDA
jgi:DNA-3-methyladenine glycosylase II